MINPSTKSGLSMFTNYEDTKDNAKCRYWVVWVVGVTQGHRKHVHSIEHLSHKLYQAVLDLKNFCWVRSKVMVWGQNLEVSQWGSAQSPS